MKENIGFIACLLIGIFCFIVYLFFKIRKGKAAKYISGFSFYSKEEQQKYDIEKMSKDMEILFLQLFFIMLIGSLISLIHSGFSIIALMIWFIRFFKEVHFDDEKAFGKYRIH